ncbi:hypothetical protein L9F63_022954 [Diploptera punctata]|uniref:Uncharacterized protein n=1 Tax=Diploptera punctata TaxID=6984 RepID=A0AAD7ZMS7_DIPPU|nr:hypothetical protein L9F63_022954 [Diploptera punctata]
MLDPFTADCLEGDIISDITGNISIHLQEVRIVGVSQFDIEKLKMNWTPITLDITLNFPHISANGSYNIGGMLGNIIPLHGNGPAELSVSNLNVTSKLFLGSLNRFIGMKSISLNYTVQEIKVNFTNIMGGGRFGDILNKVLSEEGPRILDLVRADLIQFCENWLNKHVNNVLAKLNITLTGVLDFVKVISTKKVNTILNYTPLRFEL